MFSFAPRRLISPAEALPGRDKRIFDIPDRHAVLGTVLEPPFPADLETIYFGMGCFWGSRTQVLANPRCVFNRSRLPRWLHRKSHLR